MLHKSCIDAIKQHRYDPGRSNVVLDDKNCKCNHTPTECQWVGNPSHYACLTGKNEAAQRVYDQLSGSKHTRISSPVKQR